MDIFESYENPFYIISVNNETRDLNETLEHETAHGLFYTDFEYRKEVKALLSKFDIEPIRRELRANAGYHEDVIDDEVHAYGIDSNPELETPIPEDLIKGLKSIYKKYLK